MPIDDTNPSSLVLDTSVIVELLITDAQQDFTDRFRFYLETTIPKLYVSDLFWYEITNALYAATRNKKISSESAQACLKSVESLLLTSVPLKHPSILLETAWQYDISTYEAASVCVAKQLNIPLCTVDKNLQEKIKNGVKIFKLV